jgi:heterotetrameric sarcosine oxidase gamma subunit
MHLSNSPSNSPSNIPSDGPKRHSACHEVFASRGAVFDGTSGWRYPIWYSTPSTPERAAALRREQAIVRSCVGVFDCSPLAHVLIVGPDACAVLNSLSTSNIDIEVGHVIYTHWCNDFGNIEVDAVISRIGVNRFTIAINDTLQRRTLELLQSAVANQQAIAAVIDISAAVTTIVVCGPRSREVISRYTDIKLDSSAFPPRTLKQTLFANVEVSITRVSYVGELSFELQVPTDFARYVGEIVVRACEELGGGAIGLDAVYALGTEHGMLDYDYNLDNTISPIEAGLGFTISRTKPQSFRGRAALECIYQCPPTRMVFVHCSLAVRELLAGQSLTRNGESLGSLLTVDSCHHIGRQVGVVRIKHAGVTEAWLNDGTWAVIDDEGNTPVEVTTKALYDPGRLRSRS